MVKMKPLKGILKNATRTTLQQICSSTDHDLVDEDVLVPTGECATIMANPGSDSEDEKSDAEDSESSASSASDAESIASVDPDDIPPPSQRPLSLMRDKPSKRKHKKVESKVQKKVRYRTNAGESSTNVPSATVNPLNLAASTNVDSCLVVRPDETQVYLCPHCTKKREYVRKPNFLKHLDLVHSNKPPPFKCFQCSAPFFFRSELNRHEEKQSCHRHFVEEPRSVFLPTARPTSEFGPAMDFSHLKPVEFFLFLMINVILLWVKYTNICGKKLLGESWKIFRTSDALRWLALFIAKSVLRIHRRRDAWRQNILFANDFFIETMSARRWFMIFRATSFVDKDLERKPGGRGDKTSSNYARDWRIADPIDQFLQACQRSWNPGLQICIDEMMTKFLGWCNYIVAMPKKPIKRGIKAFVLCCAKSAFILNWIPFVKQRFEKDDELGATGSTVWALLTGETVTNGRNFLNLGYHLFTDSYYTMLRLIEKLLKHVTFYCGTLAKCRQVPDGFRDLYMHDGRKMKRGMVKFLHWGKITLSNWLDGGTVLIASSLPHIVEDMSTCERQIFNKELDKWEKKIVPCPKIVEEYNNYMAGVDRADQTIAAFHVHVKQQKWFMVIWFRLIEMALFNAHVLYKYTFPGTKLANETLDFQLAVIEGLVQVADNMDGVRRREDDRRVYPNDLQYDLHMPIAPIVTRNMRLYQTASGRKLMEKMRFNRNSMHLPHPAASIKGCVVCGDGHRVSLCCSYCRVNLHSGRCYERWHKLHHYKY